MPVVSFSSEQLKGRRVYLLLEINFGTFGYFRLSTEPISVPGDGGGQFDGGLDGLTFTDSVDLFSTSESNRSVSVVAFLPVDVSELAARGFDPARGTASLSQWVEGTNYEDRRRVLSSLELRDPQYGESYEPFRFSIRSNLYDDGSVIPPIDANINLTTFPYAENWQVGPAYPWVFGTPGKHTDAISGSFAYHYDSVAYPIDIGTGGDRYFLVAGHEMTPNTTARVVVKGGGYTTINEQTVQTVNDGLGRRVSVVPAGTLGTAPDFVEGNEFLCTFSTGGGVLNDQQTEPRRGMGEIIEYLLDYAPRISMDRGRTRSATNQLNAYSLDAVISEPVEVWRWLRSNLLPFAPVSLATGSDGMYPIVWDKDYVASDAVASVDAVRDQWERTSPVTVEHLDGEPRNDFSISYGLRMEDGNMRYRATLSGDKAASNAYARTSHQRYGKRTKPEEEAICMYQESDVNAVLSWWSRIYGFPIRSVEYTAPIEWGWLEAGASIVFSDSRLNLSDQMAIVQAIEWSEEQIIGLRLVWVEDLPRDDRAI